MKVIYTENPLLCYVEMTEKDKVTLKDKLFAYWSDEEEADLEDARKWTEHQYPFLLGALTSGESHCGDCIKFACSCTKCYAEEILGIHTLKGIKYPHHVYRYFTKDKTIDEAIDAILKGPEKYEDWGLPHIERWTGERAACAESLKKYKQKHFPAP